MFFHSLSRKGRGGVLFEGSDSFQSGYTDKRSGYLRS